MTQPHSAEIDQAVARYRTEYERHRFDETMDEVAYLDELSDRLAEVEAARGPQSLEARALSSFLTEMESEFPLLGDEDEELDL